MNFEKKEIDVPVFNGYRFVGYEPIKNGLYTMTLCGNGLTKLSNCHLFPEGMRALLYQKIEQPFKFPDWVKKGTWLAIDKNGEGYLYAERPSCGCDRWCSFYGVHVASVQLLSFELPEYVDWTKAIWENR